MEKKTIKREILESVSEFGPSLFFIMIAMMCASYKVYQIIPFCVFGLILSVILFSIKIHYERKAQKKTITTEQLIKKYPKIFQDYPGNPEQCNWHGVPEGWLPIIDWLCGSIQNYIDNTSTYKDGKKTYPPQVTCFQMKEKFGGLRFYTNGNDDIVEGMIEMAEYMCDNTCECCQTHDNLGHTQGWITVRCKSCAGTNKWKPKTSKNENI